MIRTKHPQKSKGHAGRIGYFQPIMLHQVRCFAKKGATDKEIADFFQVCVSTIDYWKRNRPDFLQALEEGKAVKDDEVEKSLLENATGYTYMEVSHFEGTNTKGESYEYTRTTKKHIRGDVTAQIFWLTNRRRERWQHVHRAEIQADININETKTIDLTGLTDQEKQWLKNIGIKQLQSIHGVSDN